jgi:ABC-type nitrate/sulfonate/bicarbonate transport system ATPase subunit
MRLECQDITYGYAGSAHPVIENLSLTIDEPGLHALFGPSGVGKSSLAKVMAKMVAPQSGTIRVDGDGPVFYSHNMERLPDWSPVGRHMDRITPDQHVSLRTELIAAFGLEALLGHRFSQLSLGQQNRINLLRYLVQDFQVLIMDESLANVDEQTREQILLTIKGFFPDSVFYLHQPQCRGGRHLLPSDLGLAGQAQIAPGALPHRAGFSVGSTAGSQCS